jgi:hypothetical protein
MMLMLACIPFISFAQANGGGGKDREEMRMRFEARQAEFMTRELNLTAEEGQRFWPVFNNYSREVRTVLRNSRGVDSIEKRNRVIEVRRKFQNDFSQMLGEERGKRVYPAEDRFLKMTRSSMERRRQSGIRKSVGRSPGGNLPY